MSITIMHSGVPVPPKDWHRIKGTITNKEDGYEAEVECRRGIMEHDGRDYVQEVYDKVFGSKGVNKVNHTLGKRVKFAEGTKAHVTWLFNEDGVAEIAVIDELARPVKKVEGTITVGGSEVKGPVFHTPDSESDS